MGQLSLDPLHKVNGTAVSGPVPQNDFLPVPQREWDSCFWICTSKGTGQLFLDLYLKGNGTAVSGPVY